MSVEVGTRKGAETGRAVLYECAYAWTCRQVVTNISGQVGHFDLQQDIVSIVVRVSRPDMKQDTVSIVVMVNWPNIHQLLCCTVDTCGAHVGLT